MQEKSQRRVELLKTAIEFVEKSGGLPNARQLLLAVDSIDKVKTVQTVVKPDEEPTDDYE